MPIAIRKRDHARTNRLKQSTRPRRGSSSALGPVAPPDSPRQPYRFPNLLRRHFRLAFAPLVEENGVLCHPIAVASKQVFQLDQKCVTIRLTLFDWHSFQRLSAHAEEPRGHIMGSQTQDCAYVTDSTRLEATSQAIAADLGRRGYSVIVRSHSGSDAILHHSRTSDGSEKNGIPSETAIDVAAGPPAPCGRACAQRRPMSGSSWSEALC